MWRVWRLCTVARFGSGVSVCRRALACRVTPPAALWEGGAKVGDAMRTVLQRAVRSPRRVVWAGVVLAGGVAVAACTNNPSASTESSTTTTTTSSHTSSTSHGSGSSGSGSGSSATKLSTVLSHIKQNSGMTFSVTYNLMEAGKSQTVTFAQKPPKEAIITPEGSYYVDGTSVIVCMGQGSSAHCTSLPSSAAAGANAISDLFSPGVLTSTLQGIEGEVSAHIAGVSISSSSATYGGQDSTCVSVTKTGQPQVMYCASNSSGVLTYFSAGGNSGTLTAYDANPPDSTFSPPAGATVETLPSGV